MNVLWAEAKRRPRISLGRTRRGTVGLGRTALALGDLTYPCDVRHTWVESFYGAFLDESPTVDPGCVLSRLITLCQIPG